MCTATRQDKTGQERENKAAGAKKTGVLGNKATGNGTGAQKADSWCQERGKGIGRGKAEERERKSEREIFYGIAVFIC